MKIEKALFGIEENETITFRRVLQIILVCLFTIVANYEFSKLADKIIFPLYLDSIFTIGAVALCGLIPGILCAFFTNLFITFETHSPLLFSICHICTAIVAWIVFYIEDLKSSNLQNKKINKKTNRLVIDNFLWAGFFASIINGVIGNAIADLVLAANPERPSANIVLQGIYVAVPNLTFANNFSGYLENLVDKLLSALISLAFYNIVLKIWNRKKN